MNENALSYGFILTWAWGARDVSRRQRKRSPKMNPLPQSFATMATSRHLAAVTYQWNATGVFMVCLCVIVPVRDNTINRFFSNPIFLKMTTRSNNSPPPPANPQSTQNRYCVVSSTSTCSDCTPVKATTAKPTLPKAFASLDCYWPNVLVWHCRWIKPTVREKNPPNSPPMQPHHSPDTISPCFPVFLSCCCPSPPSPPRNRFGDDWLRDVSIRLLWFSG